MRYLSIAVAAAALALTVTGCGGGDDTAATTTTQAAAGGGSSADPRAAFTECLRKNGVTLPTGRPSRGPDGRPSGRPSTWPKERPSAWPSGRPSGGFGGFRSMDPAMSKAFEACRSLMPQGGRGGFGGRRGADPQAMQAFRTCMKDNGAELPADGRVRGLATADPKVAKAYDKCKVLLPTPTAAPTG
ncbi:hypothetical protein SAMN05421833_12366 [Microbispora rosea]|uniref:PT repeat-containing protein n=1 Tax=Microbispora rosea TaxID=58117 RepID=A0A1N7FPS0_9ACTN|nr:hypothetical protein [Microbispora rosea]GIH50774.1 hypothetical protein Mro03_59530 [Microbispora rosea subsp. rosea]SIS02323.1 hypothetical protein SAMN05421833_12366 [Microbispora rosea]